MAEYVNPLIFWSPGIIQIVIFPALFFQGLRKCLRGERERLVPAALVTVAGICLFLTTALSSVVWDNSDLLQGNQFPWRMLGPFVFFLSLLFMRNVGSFPLLLDWLPGLLLLQGLLFLVFQQQHFDQGIIPGELSKRVAEYGERLEGWGVDEFMLRPGSFPALAAGAVTGRGTILNRGLEEIGKS